MYAFAWLNGFAEVHFECSSDFSEFEVHDTLNVVKFRRNEYFHYVL